MPTDGAIGVHVPLDGPLRNRSAAAVLLCYHSVSDADLPFLAVPPDQFERHLSILRRLGFRSGTPEDLDALAHGRPLKRRVVYLTFDDGFRDNYGVACDLLEAYGFRALIFVLPRLLDSGGSLDWPDVAGERARCPSVMRSMTWAMAEELTERGHVFGSHTVTHPHLTALDEEALREELVVARARLHERLGACDTLAYPFGEWDGRVAAAAADAGYRYAFTLPHGAQRFATALSLPRIPVDHRDGAVRFSIKLLPAYRRLALSPLKGALRQLRRRA